MRSPICPEQHLPDGAPTGSRATRQVQPSSLSSVSLFRPDLWPGVTREAEEECGKNRGIWLTLQALAKIGPIPTAPKTPLSDSFLFAC